PYNQLKMTESGTTLAIILLRCAAADLRQYVPEQAALAYDSGRRAPASVDRQYTGTISSLLAWRGIYCSHPLAPRLGRQHEHADTQPLWWFKASRDISLPANTGFNPCWDLWLCPCVSDPLWRPCWWVSRCLGTNRCAAAHLGRASRRIAIAPWSRRKAQDSHRLDWQGMHTRQEYKAL